MTKIMSITKVMRVFLQLLKQLSYLDSRPKDHSELLTGYL